MLFQMNQTFVCINHLFEVRNLICDKGKGMISVIFLVNPFDLIQSNFAVQLGGCTYSS